MLIYKRHIAKSISWRFIATIDTIVIAFIISSDLSSGLKIGLFEIITKIFLYFLHERLWFKYGINNANYRHIFKTISWRLLGTTDTIILSIIVTGSYSVALQIGFLENITKIILYFIHEKVWYRNNYGLEKRN